MPIKYYPNRVFKKSVPAIDRVMSIRSPRVVKGFANITSAGLDERVSCPNNWQVDSIKFNFNNSVSKNYSVKILSGINIVQNLNDYLWFQTPNTIWLKITLSPGFYTGSELAAQLAAKLTANTSLSALGITCAVAYSDTTGLFTITPSSSLMKYIDQNNTQPLPDRDSTAGFLFGLTATTDFINPIVSDTPVWGLGQESWVIDETAATNNEHYEDDIHILSIDQALHFATNTAATNVNFEVVYEEMV